MMDSEKALEKFLEDCKVGDVDQVRLALANGTVDVNRTSSCTEKWTGLVLASRFGHSEIVKVLIEHGAVVDPPGSKHYALRGACIGGHLDIVKFLVKVGGANVNQVSFGNRTPLMGAVLNNHPAIVAYLVQHGANVDVVNDFGETAMAIGEANGFKECSEILLKNTSKSV